MDERQQQSSAQHGVAQWLAEIRLLQNQLAAARQERDESLKSAANWRQLYETEAKQRRTDTAMKQEQISQLQAELAQYQGQPNRAQQNHAGQTDGQVRSQLELERSLSHLSDTELKQRLIEALQDCERLRQTLQKEREEHNQTRKSLTSALGDAVDQLTRARQMQVVTNNSVAAHVPNSEQSVE